MINASVIIPTRNRPQWLISTLKSLLLQDISSKLYEILIIDNGSTDDTKNLVQAIISKNSQHNIKYYFEPEPGSLSARHCGALNAKGEILIFTDDDIEANKGWLGSIIRAFEDKNIHLIGGPSMPVFEVEPPEWISQYWIKKNEGFLCGPLSIQFFGDRKKEIDPTRVWSLNWSIRKKTFFKEGGFHPCVIPKHLQHFQGDGETGLSLKLKAKGHRAVYLPEAKITHHIPKERLTALYFEGRFYYQGVCDSYTQIRKNGGIKNVSLPEYNPIEISSLHLSAYEQYKQIIYQRIQNSYVDGFRFHQEAVLKNDIMLEWVLRDNYLFDYTLPKF